MSKNIIPKYITIPVKKDNTVMVGLDELNGYTPCAFETSSDTYIQPNKFHIVYVRSWQKKVNINDPIKCSYCNYLLDMDDDCLSFYMRDNFFIHILCLECKQQIEDAYSKWESITKKRAKAFFKANILR